MRILTSILLEIVKEESLPEQQPADLAEAGPKSNFS